MSEKTPFQLMREINVNDKTEKKGNLTYLSWAWAVDQLLSADHAANWEYLEPLVFGETMMVRCAVTAFGKRMVAQLPVIDYKNKPISNPNCFEVNTSMQRCLAKGIALHGLGLYIYAGEDVPPDTEVAKPKGQSVAKDALESLPGDVQNRLADMAIPIKDALSAGNTDEAFDKYTEAKGQLDDEIQGAAFWALFGAAERSAIKKVGQARQ